MKSPVASGDHEWENRVAPLVGAWIEMSAMSADGTTETVAPLVGAWIEISMMSDVINADVSLPSWERGLK